MDSTRFDAALRAFATSAGWRGAVGAMGAAGVGLLAVAGAPGREDAVVAAKRRRTRRGAPQGQGGTPPEPDAPAPPDAHAIEPATESPEAGLVELEAKKGTTGPAGPTGATGPTGAAGPISTTFVAGGALLGDSLFATVFADAECPAGSQVVVGGFDTSVDGVLSNDVKVDSMFALSEIGDFRARHRVVFSRTATDIEGSILVLAIAVCSP